ncbi:MFS transporter [Streptomyces sp. 21So2-11]|uniref:MFS transporter n=1 Tax=Streptomyces sp. 21So2-11 TaxID=3144408 RepID=UPI00321B392F
MTPLKSPRPPNPPNPPQSRQSPNPPQSPGRAAAPTAWSPRLWGLLTVLAGNMLIDALEVSALVVAMPSIGADLDLPLTVLQWTMSGFAIGFGGLLLFGGRVVTLLGRRRVYLAALVAFAAASVVAGLTSDPALLTATRIVKGFCAALTAPTGLAIISTAFKEGPDRTRAMSVYTLFGASGFTAGLLVSGLLTDVSWRWALAFPAPVVLVLFVLGLRLVPADEPPSYTPRRYGAVSALALTGSLSALVYGIVSVSQYGWSDARSIGSLVLCGALAGALVKAERSSPDPLLRAGLLKNGPLIRSALGAAALNGSYLGLLIILTFQLQELWGWSPLLTAVALLPASAPLAVTALMSGRMVNRFGAPRLIALGALTPLAGYVLYLWQRDPVSYAADVLPVLLLVGAGFVLAFAALNMQAVSGVPAAERGPTGAVYQSAVQLGAVLMIALVAALLFAHRAPPEASPAAVLEGYRPAAALVAGVGLLGFLAGLAGVLPRAGAPRRPSAEPRSPEPCSPEPETANRKE